MGKRDGIHRQDAKDAKCRVSWNDNEMGETNEKKQGKEREIR
jgi:hypothetical protein